MSEWIPVSERLPEECGYYLISTAGFDVLEGFYDGKEWWHEGKGHTWREVVAWMPKPSAYRSILKPYKASPTGAESEE